MIELAINCFERNYRTVLTPTFVESVRAQQARDVSMLVLVSNVDDPSELRGRAAEVSALPDTRVVNVAEHLGRALRQTHLTRRSFGALLWYSAAPLVAVTLDGPDWLVYWDADIFLPEPYDWITPSTELMDADRRIAVANPSWYTPGNHDTLDDHALERPGDFVLGHHNFSDQCFLVRRDEFARPIYRHRHPTPWMFQTAPSGRLFEYRVDAYLQQSGRLRATCTSATYTHPQGGSSYPTDRWTPVRSLAVRARRRLAR